MSRTVIEIILGCMFSGKSTELLRRCRRYSSIGHAVLYINHSFDTRTDDFIQTHRGEKEHAVKCSSLMSIIDDPDVQQAQVIGIDESQFFEDLLEFVLVMEQQNKIIIIAGLDGDSNRKPFGHILECIPLCDSVVKLTAMDMVDKDGSTAIFSKRVIHSSEQICVGASESYLAVSRQNYFK